jgi:serine/threonine-protein kinase
MLWLADCYDRQGKTASAWGQFLEAAEIAARQKDTREKVARQRAANLEPKLSRLVVVVAGENEVAGLEVKRDGTAIGKPLWGTAVPVDPGAHNVVAGASGYKTWDSNVEVTGGGKTVKVSIPKLAPEPGAQPAASATPPAEPEPEPKERGGTQRIVGVGVMGLGIVAVGLGVVFGLSAKSKLSDSNADNHCHPDNHCDALGYQLRNDAKDAAALSTISFVAGAIVIGVGATLYLTAPRGKPKSGSVRVVPTFGAGAAGLGMAGDF